MSCYFPSCNSSVVNKNKFQLLLQFVFTCLLLFPNSTSKSFFFFSYSHTMSSDNCPCRHWGQNPTILGKFWSSFILLEFTILEFFYSSPSPPILSHPLRTVKTILLHSIYMMQHSSRPLIDMHNIVSFSLEEKISNLLHFTVWVLTVIEVHL